MRRRAKPLGLGWLVLIYPPLENCDIYMGGMDGWMDGDGWLNRLGSGVVNKRPYFSRADGRFKAFGSVLILGVVEKVLCKERMAFGSGRVVQR